jgi:hypothetical protein
MFPERKPFPKIPDNSKIGITVFLNNQKESGEPFEATVVLKKPGKNPEELQGESAVTLAATGKLRLDIGKNSYVEIFAENSCKLKDADTETESCVTDKEEDNNG